MAIPLRFEGRTTVKPSQEVKINEAISFDKINKNTYNRRIKASLSDNRLLDVQKEVMGRFDNHLFNLGLRITTRTRYLQTLRSLGKTINKDFRELDKEDIETFLIAFKDSKPSTFFNTKLVLKLFFRWMYTEYKGWKKTLDEPYPEIVNWVVLKRTNGYKLPEEILTLEEVKKIISTAKNFRDRALLFVLYESACRKSELLACQIKHVCFDKYGGFITIPESKTYTRKIRLINSVPDLKLWLDNHPLADNPNSPLWISLGSWKGNALGVDGLKRIIKLTSKDAKIKKNVYPHLFRHSRLTELAREGFNETELRQIAGWSKNSNMPSVYIHLAGGDVDKKMLLKAGVLDNENIEEINREKETLKVKICPNCKTENTAIAKFCKNSACNFILDYKFAMDVDSKREKADNIMTAILEKINEKNKELVLEAIEELKLKSKIKNL